MGSKNVNGCYHAYWSRWEYLGVDIETGDNVDKVVPESGDWDLGRQFDVVISGQCLEHVRRPWVLAETIGKHLKAGGLLFLCAPFKIEIHNHPIDCWRFCPDGMKELVRLAGCEVLESKLSSNDCYAIGKKT